MRSSRQRDAVLEVLRSSCDHPTADMIFERVRTEIPNISLGTVYRNLGQLKDEGFITVVESSDTKVHYEGNLTDHIHFLCKKCHNITDVWCKSPVPSQLAKMGLQVESQKTVYYGVCKNCRDNIN
ncbi:MAG: transcriptional repressor [Clostridia bacterium]|nr:transcriptional repressor [Clostridia bacterium]